MSGTAPQELPPALDAVGPRHGLPPLPLEAVAAYHAVAGAVLDCSSQSCGRASSGPKRPASWDCVGEAVGPVVNRTCGDRGRSNTLRPRSASRNTFVAALPHTAAFWTLTICRHIAAQIQAWQRNRDKKVWQRHGLPCRDDR